MNTTRRARTAAYFALAFLQTQSLCPLGAAPPMATSSSQDTDAPRYRLREVPLPMGARGATATAIAGNGDTAGVADVVERPVIRPVGPPAPGLGRGGANSYSYFDRDAPYVHRDTLNVLVLAYLLFNWHLVRDFYRRPIDDDETGSRGPSGAGKRVRVMTRQAFTATNEGKSRLVSGNSNGNKTPEGFPALAVASGINTRGVVVGLVPSALDENRSRAFVWTNEGKEPNRGRDLGTFGGPGSAAWGINEAGRIVGDAQMDGGVLRAFAVDLPSTNEPLRLHDLGTLGGSQSRARAINNAGRVVGSAETTDYETRACVWETGASTLALSPAVPLSVPARTLSSEAVAVASDGTAAGRVEVTKGHFVPAVWSAGGECTVLPTLSDGQQAEATGVAIVNGTVIVVGMSDIAPPKETAPAKEDTLPPVPPLPERRPFLWHGGRLYDLSRLVSAPGWTLLGVSAINDRGEIAGWGRYKKRVQSFVLYLETNSNQTASK